MKSFFAKPIFVMAIWSFLFRPELQADETIVFYPTAATWDAARAEWLVPIHANVHEPEIDSIKRRVLLSLLTSLLDTSDDAVDTDLFKTRARAFLVDNERGKEIRIKVGDRDETVGKTSANGHVTGELRIDRATLAKLAPQPGKNPWLTVSAIVPETEKRKFEASIQLIEPQGITIISDLDDTIKASNVTDRRELLRNTFLRPFVAVPGMSAQYARWQEQGAVFHYLSASPWQLYVVLDEFRETEKFPRGVWTMKHLRLTDRSAVDFFRGHVEYKTTAIEDELKRNPERRFVLIGDTGEEDPEIYGAIARKYPERIVKILIRNAKSGKESAERYAKAFAELPVERWQVFDDAQELKESLRPEWFETRISKP